MVAHTILVAEDNEDDVLLLKRAFDRVHLDIDLRFVGDGEEGIAYMQGTGHYSKRSDFPIPHLILTDLKMPKVNGFDFLSWLREHAESQCTPVVVLSSSGDRNDINRAYKIGANSFLTKPMALGDLEELVQTLHHYWLTLNQFPDPCL